MDVIAQPGPGWPGRAGRFTEHPTMQSIQEVPRTPRVLTSRGWGRRVSDQAGSLPGSQFASLTHSIPSLSKRNVQITMGRKGDCLTRPHSPDSGGGGGSHHSGQDLQVQVLVGHLQRGGSGSEM